MKHEKYLATLVSICFVSYFMMFNISMTAEAKDMPVSKNLSKSDSVVYILKDTYIQDQKLIEYAKNLTNLSYEECSFMLEECKKSHIDPFVILGLMKRESNFDQYAVGQAGERGLGQLMESTANIVAENLGYDHNPENLFNPKYNIKLTISQLSYLYNLYEKDINKALTAYNRGQQGLSEYMKEKRSPYKNLAMSEYSAQILDYTNEFKEEFVKYKN